jgi:hypothetical protein
MARPAPALSGGWHVDPFHSDGLLVVLALDGRPIRFVAAPLHPQPLAADLCQAAKDRDSRDGD